MALDAFQHTQIASVEYLGATVRKLLPIERYSLQLRPAAGSAVLMSGSFDAQSRGPQQTQATLSNCQNPTGLSTTDADKIN